MASRLADVARRAFRLLVDRFAENNLLTYASAIAFQLLVALVPLTALALVLMGLFGLDEIWNEQLAPRVREKAPPLTFVAIDAVVSQVLDSPKLLWLVLGAAIALWEVSGSVRAVMGATNEIYGGDEHRGIVHRFALSFALALGVIVCVLGAGWSATFSAGIPAVPGGVELPLRWLLALALVWLMLLMLLRFAPAESPPVQWISVGSVLVVVVWFTVSLLYGLYVQRFVALESAFGFVAVGLVTTGYLYASSIVFLLGVQVDELLRSGEARRALRA